MIADALEILRGAQGGAGDCCIVYAVSQPVKMLYRPRDSFKHGRYVHDVCDKDFDYKSKYERHLQTQVHKDKLYSIAYGQITEEENYIHRSLHEADPLLLTGCETYQHLQNELKIIY